MIKIRSETRERRKVLSREPFRMISTIYSAQKTTSRKRGHEPPSYSLEEFQEWFIHQPNYSWLMLDWRLRGYPKKLKPSPDRINESKGYSLDNLQLGTWEENNSRPRQALYKPVILTNIKTGNTIEFNSITEAGSILGISISGLSQAASGGIKYIKGYYVKKR